MWTKNIAVIAEKGLVVRLALRMDVPGSTHPGSDRLAQPA
jgi:hypothetical protein